MHSGTCVIWISWDQQTVSRLSRCSDFQGHFIWFGTAYNCLDYAGVFIFSSVGFTVYAVCNKWFTTSQIVFHQWLKTCQQICENFPYAIYFVSNDLPNFFHSKIFLCTTKFNNFPLVVPAGFLSFCNFCLASSLWSAGYWACCGFNDVSADCCLLRQVIKIFQILVMAVWAKSCLLFFMISEHLQKEVPVVASCVHHLSGL